MKKIVKIVAFRGNSGNSGGDGGGDGVLNSNHRGTGRGKTAGDLGERVPWVPRGIPNSGLPDSAGPGQYTAAAQRVGVKKGHLLHVVMAFGYAST